MVISYSMGKNLKSIILYLSNKGVQTTGTTLNTSIKDVINRYMDNEFLRLEVWLEPCDWKQLRTVLRGVRTGNSPILPDYSEPANRVMSN